MAPRFGAVTRESCAGLETPKARDNDAPRRLSGWRDAGTLSAAELAASGSSEAAADGERTESR